MVSIKKVLVVDDEPGIRRLLADVLSSSTCHVVMACDGLEAVTILKRRRFDAVVTDINMPGMDGIELLRWMKANRRKEPVVVMSGSPDHEVLPGRGLSPVAARFRKPFRLPVFMETMTTLLDTERRGSRSRLKAKRKGVA